MRISEKTFAGLIIGPERYVIIEQTQIHSIPVLSPHWGFLYYVDDILILYTLNLLQSNLPPQQNIMTSIDIKNFVQILTHKWYPYFTFTGDLRDIFLFLWKKGMKILESALNEGWDGNVLKGFKLVMITEVLNLCIFFIKVSLAKIKWLWRLIIFPAILQQNCCL